MFRATLASIRANQLRLLATSLAIVVGVAFVAGTLILSDTLQSTFDDLFAETTQGIDVAVTGPEDSADPFTGQRAPVSSEVLDLVEDVDGIRAVSPEVQGIGQLVDADGEAVGGFGPPTLVFNAPITAEIAELIDNPSVRDGRLPTTQGEVAVDVAALEALEAEIGDTVGLSLSGPVTDVTIVGTVGFGELDNLGGATLVLLDPDTAFDALGEDGFTQLSVIGEDGVDDTVLRDDITAALTDAGVADQVEVLTQLESADQAAADVSEGLGFFTTALLVFAGVALFVGAFLIANTFTIIVAQRTRELALLRAVGASRRQVLASVLGEALATGIIGSLGGFALGVGLAQGLYILLDAFGIALPQGDLVVSTGTFVTSFLLGTVLTLVMAVLPAIRSTRVPPVAALQAVAAPPVSTGGRLRYVIGGLFFAMGVGGLAFALATQSGIEVVGGLAVLTLVSASFLAPLVTRPLIRAIGGPLGSLRGMPGELATQNALRNPQRTASTASALMIGLALVSFIAILGSSFSTSVANTIEESFTGDLVVNAGGFGGGFGVDPGPELIEQLRAVDGIDLAVQESMAQPEVDGSQQFVFGTQPGAYEQVVDLTIVEGGEQGLVTGGVAVDDMTAEDLGLAVGDTVEVVFAGTASTVEVVTIYESGGTDSGFLFDQSLVDGDGFMFSTAYLTLTDDADPDAVSADVESLLSASYPSLQVQDLTGFSEQITGQINQLLGLVSALLGLSVIVALFGIVNTLGLSVFERTRELGLLRAVGGTRSQVRAMIRWESVLIALLGAIFGLVIGVLFAWLVVTALGDTAGLTLSIPPGQILGGLIASAIAGVLASIIPARRASKIDILRAIETA